MTEALIAIGAIIAAVFAAWFGGRRSAKTAQKLDALEDKADALETRNEIDNRVARERDARDKLRTDWGQ
jgi:hypothetical protein